MTRSRERALSQRGAAGVTVLSLPGLLAACGGGAERRRGRRGAEGRPQLLELGALHRHAVDPKSGRPERPDDAPAVHGGDRHQGQLLRGRQRQRRLLREGPGEAVRGEGIDRDIIVSTDNDRFLGEYITNDWALKLDKSLIPNISNLIDAQASPPFDPNRDYSLPWFSGMDGIAWNEDLTGPVTTVTQLLEDPKLKGKVGVWNSMGDTLGLIMLENGDDPAKVTDESFDRALAVVQKAQDAGQIRRFYGNDYAQPLATGDLAASMAWSGDIFALQVPKVKWGIAEKGGIIWTDNMLIPLGGSVPTASTYMNFVYDPKIAAELALGGGYISSVKGVREEAVKLDPERGGQHARLPHRRDVLADAPERSDDVLEPRLREEVARGPGQVGRRDGVVLPPTQGLHAVPPPCAGSPLAGDLLRHPDGVPRLPVAAVGALPALRVHVGVLELLERRQRLPRATDPLVPLCRHRDGRLPRARVSARVLDRISGRSVAEPLPPLHHRAVLRHVPRADAGVAEHPRRPGAGRRPPPRPPHPRPGRASARDDVRRRLRHHLQLLPLHGAAAVRLSRADRSAPARGGEGPLRVVDARRFSRSRCRSRRPASSPARC